MYGGGGGVATARPRTGWRGRGRWSRRPKTTRALAEGEISYQHASLIARTRQRLGELWPDDAEQILVTAAQEVDPVRLRCATIQLRHCLEPDGVLEDANAAEDRRCLHLNQTFGGIFAPRRSDEPMP